MKLTGVVVGFAVLLAAGRANAWCQETTCNDPDASTCPRNDNGCKTTGAGRAWRTLPIVFRFTTMHPATILREDARAAIRAAFYRWSDTLCGANQERTSLRFSEGEELTTEKPLVANSHGVEPFGIYFRDNAWPYVGTADSTLAQTNVDFIKDKGWFTYADIEINTGISKFTTTDDGDGNDLQAVITHEVGHYIGLDHSKVADSIMVPAYCQDLDARCGKGVVAARRLANDDIDAVCTLYPPGRVNETTTAAAEQAGTQGGCAMSPRRDDAWIPLLGLGVALGVIARKRLRR